MQVIGLFILFAVILDAIAVGICSIIERYSELASPWILRGELHHRLAGGGACHRAISRLGVTTQSR